MEIYFKTWHGITGSRNVRLIINGKKHVFEVTRFSPLRTYRCFRKWKFKTYFGYHNSEKYFAFNVAILGFTLLFSYWKPKYWK